MASGDWPPRGLFLHCRLRPLSSKACWPQTQPFACRISPNSWYLLIRQGLGAIRPKLLGPCRAQTPLTRHTTLSDPPLPCGAPLPCSPLSATAAIASGQTPATRDFSPPQQPCLSTAQQSLFYVTASPGCIFVLNQPPIPPIPTGQQPPEQKGQVWTQGPTSTRGSGLS